MPRRAQRAAALAASALLAISLAGCGDESGPVATGTTSSSATPRTGASAPTQPVGVHGVTFEIVNWSDYADNPVVLSWKQAIEAFYGSVNAREPNTDFLRLTAGAQRRLWVGNINYAREHDLVGAALLKGRVVRVDVRDRKAILVGCDLRQTTNFRTRGKAYSGKEKGWHQMRNTFILRGQGPRQRWVMTNSASQGRCSKGS